MTIRMKTGKGKTKRGSSEKDAGNLFMDCSHQLPSKYVTRLAKELVNVLLFSANQNSYKLNSDQRIQSC